MGVKRRPEDRTSDQERVLKRVFKYSPKLKEAYRYKQQLTKIFDTHLSRANARRRLNAWMERVEQSELSCYDSFKRTLRRKLDYILNYFNERWSSGFVEGLNQKIKVLKRRGYGMFNIGRLFQRIWLDVEGYKRLRLKFGAVAK